MERAFIATTDSELYKDMAKYCERLDNQKDFINKFFDEKGIETVSYLIRGNGGVNKPFDEWYKNEISLCIVPTENDINKFGNNLSKPFGEGICKFKKSSKIAKEFAQRCVNEKVIINVYQPSIGDYFDCLALGGYRLLQLPLDDEWYIKIDSERLDAEELPQGFIEIKISEFYQAKERYEAENNK